MAIKTKTGTFLMMAALAFAMTACGGAKEKLGLTKKSPDEFAVVKRAPLSMPPDYSLRPPRPGAPRPQEQSPQEEARATVFGESANGEVYEQAVTGSDAALLTKAGASKADPGIRNKVDAETSILADKERPVIKKLLGKDSKEDAPANVVNAKEEAERLKKNKEEGKPVTAGETPSVEQ